MSNLHTNTNPLLRILSLSNDATLATTDGLLSETAERQVLYGEYFKEFVIIVKTANNPSKYAQKRLSNSVRVIPTLSNNSLSCLIAILNIANSLWSEEHFDAITAQDPFITGIAGLWLSKQFKIPIQIQLHGDFLSNKYWLNEKLINRLYNIIAVSAVMHADTIRVVSKPMEEYVTKRMNFPAERVSTCPVMVRFDFFKNANGSKLREQYKTKGTEHIVLFVGRLSKEKCLNVLLDAFSKTINVCSGTRLIIIGDGPERNSLLYDAARFGLSNMIDLPGWLAPDKVAEYMAAADVLALTSHFEGYGRVIVEAAAAGVPTVATNCAGPSYLIKDGITGYLVPINSAANIAEKIIFLLSHPVEAMQMGANARSHIEQNFDRNEIIQKTIDSIKATVYLGRKN